MERLVSYLEGNISQMVEDLLPSLREADPVFKQNDKRVLAAALHQAAVHFAGYLRTRLDEHVEHIQRALVNLAHGGTLPTFPVSALIRIFFGLEDLLAIRAQGLYRDQELFVDELRMVRAVQRELLCSLADRLRPAIVAGRNPLESQPVVRGRPPSRDPGPPAEKLLERFTTVPFKGREAALHHLWERLQGQMGDRRQHQIVGITGEEGVGRSSLITAFLSQVREQAAGAPVVLEARTPRLFNLPLWPFSALLRSYFRTGFAESGSAERVRASLVRLASGIGKPALEAAAPHLIDFLGSSAAAERPIRLGKTNGLRLRRALALALRGMAAQAQATSHMPLFVRILDASEMDGPSWSLLQELLHTVPADAPIFVALTYGPRFSPPASISGQPGFSEFALEPLDIRCSEAIIDGLLHPNRLDEQTRFRLTAAAHGSPLILVEAIRQLVADEVIGIANDTWYQRTGLPEEGVPADLGVVVGRRVGRLDRDTNDVLDTLVVIEDTLTTDVLQEVLSRRAIGPGEIENSLEQLIRLGLVERTDEIAGLRIRHPLVRDELYRHMGQERRRALHEDVGEVYERLSGAGAYPSLAAAHLALAALPMRALQGLLQGADRCLAVQNVEGARELCNQALGLLKGLPPHEQDRLLFEVLTRRERIYGQQDAFDKQAADLHQLAAIVDRVPGPEAQLTVLARRARTALQGGLAGATDEAIAAFQVAAQGDPERRVRGLLVGALNLWQKGSSDQAARIIEEALGGGAPPQMQGRLLHLQAHFLARTGHLDDATESLLSAWESYTAADDLHGGSLVLVDLGEHAWTRGHFVDAMRHFRRAIGVLHAAADPRALGRALLGHAGLCRFLGQQEEAQALYDEALRLARVDQNQMLYSTATVGMGRVLLNQRRLDDAMRLLAHCLKDLGRVAMRQPLYVEGLNALSMTLSSMQGEKLLVGALRYSGEAADRAADIDAHDGLIEALVVQVRVLVILGRLQEAEARMRQLDQSFTKACARHPQLQRMAAGVEHHRARLLQALGQHGEATAARRRALAELNAQLDCLTGTPFESSYIDSNLINSEIRAECA